MIFQKKIIIGSIMSFIATAVGIIAVFFPDLLNLQKEKIKKYSIFLNDKKSLNEFHQFIKKNTDSVVELKVLYCSTGYNPDTYEYSEHENIIKSSDPNLPYLIAITTGEVDDGGGEIAASRLGGTFTMFTEDETEKEVNITINMDDNNKRSKTFSWRYDTAGYLDENKQFLDKCPIDKENYDAIPSMGQLSGIFFITEGDPRPSELFHIATSYDLEVLSKADLKLKNY